MTIRQVVTLSTPGRHADDGNLNLSISKTGVKSWVLLFKLKCRQREMGLGSAGQDTADLHLQSEHGIAMAFPNYEPPAVPLAETIETFPPRAETLLKLGDSMLLAKVDLLPPGPAHLADTTSWGRQKKRQP